MTSLAIPMMSLLDRAVLPADQADDGPDRHDRATHERAYGELSAVDPGWLLSQVRAVALTGRGGAHFPVEGKWAAATAAAVPGWTVVANGAEGEPASRKDAVLLQQRPHLVLDGAELAAAMVGASRIVIWLTEQSVASARSVRSAIDERSHRPGPRPEIVLTRDRYLSGESSSIIQAMQGGPALPRAASQPGRSWAGGSPVLVHNVETLARLALLARTGAEGQVARSLVTVTTGQRRLVVEAAADETFAELFGRVGAPPPQAVLLGGFGGEWVGWPELAAMYVDPQRLRTGRRSLGAGVLVTLRPDECGLRAVAPIATWLAEQSAGQCGPCRFGLPAIADLTARLAAHPTRRDLERLREHLGLVDGRGACRLPDGAVRMIRSALETFAPEVEAHRHGRCITDAVHRVRGARAAR